jgi:molecular chaperone HtpG
METPRIQLPKLFEQILKQKPSLASDVTKSLDAFTPWLEQSGMPFFPGFTDHSPRHINDVLATAASVMSDSSRELLTPEDAAVLVIAVLLHDCGMHLTQDSFRALIETESRPPVDGLGDRPWKQIWGEFLAEAQRFGEDRLQAVFGETSPVVLKDLDVENLSERDCLLVGEFVRRHHARLAHEIALSGVPSRMESRLKLIGMDAELLDLAGLVARSHGLSIRATFHYLESRYGRISEQRKTKTPYLMAVLRIADYVQVQSERALKALLSVKELRSPISRQEWRNHFAVRDVSLRHEDPEAMYVHASPTDVKTYLRLDSLFRDIQRELDDSWATIGEVYGRLGELGSLGLTVRRIRSNLDDAPGFAATVAYIPIRAAFKSSGPDLLKLLVGPLYDYRHEVGVRELLQNAIDACKERFDLTGNRGSEVTVNIEQADDGTGWITVTDTGVGMTLETITNYFLVAGASFRNSDLWKRRHQDEKGSPRVLRGGRFGVGALAAFMLGEEVTVRTRHMDRDASEGLEFSARIDDPVIELRRCTADAGTSIRIWVQDKDVFKSLSPFEHPIERSKVTSDTLTVDTWKNVDWFAQTSPKVTVRWFGNVEVYEGTYLDRKEVKLHVMFSPSKHLVPQGKAEEGWYSLPDPKPYRHIFWQYPALEKHASGDRTWYRELILPPKNVLHS